MKKKTIALISGGISSEREVSINSGNQVFEALDKNKYEVLRYDPKTDIKRLVDDAPKIDAALIILHGLYGEDGTVQGLLELLDIPYQGAGVLGSGIAMNKLTSKQLYTNAGLNIPPYIVVKKDETGIPSDYAKQIGYPIVVKPVEGGSSIGMSIVKDDNALIQAMEKAFTHDRNIILEAFIDGIEITGGVLGNEELQAFPLIEIIPDENHDFFDYDAKYTAGATTEICPARIDKEMAKKARSYAKKAHKALFCKGYSRTDMILNDKELFVLETNTIPGMTPTSLLPQAAAAYGLSFSQLMDRLIELGIEAHQNRITGRN